MLDIPSFPTPSSGPEAKLLEPSLADVEASIRGDASLPKSTRDAWCCSTRRVAKFLGRDPAQLPARLGALRFGIAHLLLVDHQSSNSYAGTRRTVIRLPN